MSDKKNKAPKHDKGKANFGGIPPRPMFEIAQVFSLGFDRLYPKRSWEKGLDWSQWYSGIQRHLWKWWGKQQKDKESRLHHLAHVAATAMILMEYEYRNLGKDDRGEEINWVEEDLLWDTNIMEEIKNEFTKKNKRRFSK